MASERQARRRLSRQLSKETQGARKADTPKLWQGYNKNNLGNVTDAAGMKSTGFVSGNESVSPGDPTCFVGAPGQPGVIVRRTVPSITEWSWASRLLGRFMAILNHYGTNTIDRVGIGEPVRVEPPAPIADLQQADDRALIWADSPSNWFGLTWNLRRNHRDELVWIDRGQAQLITSSDAVGLTSVFSNLEYVLANHFAQGFHGINEAGVAGPLAAKNHFFDLRLGELSTAALTGSYTPPAGLPPGSDTPGSLTVSGEVELFKGLLLDATFGASYSYDQGVEAVDGPWPIPGASYKYVYYRNRGPSPSGIGYPIGSDPCAPDYFTFLSGQVSSQFANVWRGSVPRPIVSGADPNGYLYAYFANSVGIVYSNYFDNSTPPGIPIPGVSYRSVIGGFGDLSYRTGNLIFFTVLADLYPIEQLTVSAIYPNPPVVPAEIYQAKFLGPTTTENFALTHSDVDPCNDPRPYQRSFEEYTYEATGNRYQPIARNGNRVIYHSATGINYSFVSSNRGEAASGGATLAERSVTRETTWSANHKCVLHDLGSDEKVEVSAYPPISLPFPAIDMAEVGVAYSFDYSNINGFEYRKFSPAPNNGATLYKDYDPLGQLTAISAVSSEWKSWFAAIVARGDIPCFGKTYGLISTNPDVYGVKVYKGRITAIAYDDSLADIRPLFNFGSLRSANKNSWPVEWLSFTLVIDEFLAEVGNNQQYIEGCYFMGFDDLRYISSGSGTAPQWQGLAILDTGSLLSASANSNSDYAYDLASLEVGLQNPLRDPGRELEAGYLYQLPSQTLAGYTVRYIWRTLATDPPEDELTVMYRYDEDSSFYFARYQLDDLIFPERPDDRIYTLHPVFNLVKNEVSGIYEVFFDRIDLIPNDITKEYLEDPDNNVYKFADANVLPPEA